MSLTIQTTGFENYLDPSGGLYVKCLIVGPPDVGKTRSSSFWPKPIIAFCEDGAMSVADRKVPFARIRSTQDMDDLIEHVRQDARLPVDKRKYLTIVVDTVDAYQRIAIDERLKAENKIALSGWGDWGYLDAKMTQFITNLTNLPMNIVVNLHPKSITEGDDEKSTTIWAPRLKGDFKDQIFGEFDLVGFMETAYVAQEGKRVRKRMVRWHQEPTFPFLKDRSGRLPRFTDIDFSEQDYQRIFDSIVGDHLDALPKSEALESIGGATPLAAPADVAGGPVDPGKLPPKPATKKAAAAKKTASKGKSPADSPAVQDAAAEAVSNPTPETVAAAHETAVGAGTESAPETSAEPDPPTPVEAMDQATELVQEQLGGEVIEDTATAEVPAVEQPPEAPTKTAAAVAKCGDQTPAMQGKFPPAEGCGKPLDGESPDQINLRILRTKTKLCGDCFAKWKANQG